MKKTTKNNKNNNINESNVNLEIENEEDELLDDFEGIDVEKLLPSMNVSPKAMFSIEDRKECIVSDNEIKGLYDEILDNARQDRESTDELLLNFVDMVLNDGESSSASKEAIVNLMKIKSDISDKMTKIAELMTRLKLKDRDTFPRYLAAQQNNKVVIEGDRREMIKQFNKLAEVKKNDK